ncbi:hypothetical protein GCM10009839_16230 [Catenulispora yoronensis]|uniref:N-acetyltransferase domain-containing protein n=2 Tax=Catenulispora yoronensis TaxID=450799 RepID=A0ABN2TUL1_9ACTN
MNPHTFQVPTAEGLAEWLDERMAFYQDSQELLSLVAEVDGVVIGTLTAVLHEPSETAVRQVQTDLGRRRLHIDNLGVAGSHRRAGVGSALMRAAEEWGRERGAEVVLLETEANNPMSVPFYEERMGFSAEVVVFRKEIGVLGE